MSDPNITELAKSFHRARGLRRGSRGQTGFFNQSEAQRRAVQRERVLAHCRKTGQPIPPEFADAPEAPTAPAGVVPPLEAPEVPKKGKANAAKGKAEAKKTEPEPIPAPPVKGKIDESGIGIPETVLPPPGSAGAQTPSDPADPAKEDWQ